MNSFSFSVEVFEANPANKSSQREGGELPVGVREPKGPEPQ